MKQGDKVKLVHDVEPLLRKGEEGVFIKLISGGYEVEFKDYPYGYGKTLSSKGNKIRLAYGMIKPAHEFNFLGIKIIF